MGVDGDRPTTIIAYGFWWQLRGDRHMETLTHARRERTGDRQSAQINLSFVCVFSCGVCGTYYYVCHSSISILNAPNSDANCLE